MMAKSYSYVRSAYGVDPIVGQRVRHTVTDRLGEVRRENKSCSHYVMVRFEGAALNLPCHPTELEYLNTQEPA